MLTTESKVKLRMAVKKPQLTQLDRYLIVYVGSLVLVETLPLKHWRFYDPESLKNAHKK